MNQSFSASYWTLAEKDDVVNGFLDQYSELCVSNLERLDLLNKLLAALETSVSPDGLNMLSRLLGRWEPLDRALVNKLLALGVDPNISVVMDPQGSVWLSLFDAHRARAAKDPDQRRRPALLVAALHGQVECGADTRGGRTVGGYYMGTEVKRVLDQPKAFRTGNLEEDDRRMVRLRQCMYILDGDRNNRGKVPLLPELAACGKWPIVLNVLRRNAVRGESEWNKRYSGHRAAVWAEHHGMNSIASEMVFLQEFWTTTSANEISGVHLPDGNTMRVRCAVNAAMCKSLRAEIVHLQYQLDKIRANKT